DGASGITNPGLPPAGDDGVVDFAPGGYPGFSAAMDLRARGQLSDELAFRVRADVPALWRADAFDTFDGQLWTASNDEQVSLSTGWGSDGAQVPAPALGVTPDVFTRRLVQTFYLESDQPNVLFGADRIDEVFFPAGGLRADREGTVRAPILLERGVVYSVISEVPIVPEAVLRALPDPAAGSVRALRRYLQVPEATPARVGELAREITAGARNPYERALAVQAWLQTNTEYDLGVAREPDGVDAVDHFLFETRRGFCEHIASAMAILLREAGVPTRIATGFGPGQRNPLTGYWEVRQSDAHAWVEVLLPEVGWIPFDPTFGVPVADGGWSSRFIGPEVFAAIGRTIAASVLEPVKATVGAAIRGARAAAGAWPALAGVAILVGLGLVLARRGRRRPSRTEPPDALGHAFEDLVVALETAGHARAPSGTPRELLRGIEGAADLPDGVAGHARTVVDVFERGRFAGPRARPSDAEVMRARAAAARVKDLVGHR
ncbi:MAG TPA: transglutaminase domain-containing protein, partial [Actinomycetota bacterium]